MKVQSTRNYVCICESENNARIARKCGIVNMVFCSIPHCGNCRSPMEYYILCLELCDKDASLVWSGTLLQVGIN